MKTKLASENSLKWLFPAVIFCVGLVVYSARITYSGLWLDEAVEYFYSKTMSGNIINVTQTNNMYERICLTYQPPLYNVLMYLWLKFFDSEAMFRLAGILTTLVGMLGIYNALRKVSGYKWASAGALLYIFIPKTAYYALECAEYNLMLCCEAWTLNFFVSCLKKNDNVSLAGFFIFSCLSVYSQYGAVFFVAGLYLVLLVHYFRDKAALLKIAGATVFTAVTVVLPLIYFFLLPQMIHQGSIGTSHSPTFAGNNILYDFIRSIALQAGWSVYVKAGSWNIIRIISQTAIIIPSAVASIVAIAALFKGKRLFARFMSVCVISYLLYYFSVVTSFYANTLWGGFGTRYGLFFIPLWLFTMIYAASVFCATVRAKKIFASLSLIFIAAGVSYIFSGWVKSDAREAIEVWYDKQPIHEKTLVYHRCATEFQFYIQHKADYSESWQDSVITLGAWVRNADYETMYENLKNMGILNHDVLFYIAQINYSYDPNSFMIFKQVMNDEGYVIETCYENKDAKTTGDKHVLLRLRRDSQK